MLTNTSLTLIHPDEAQLEDVAATLTVQDVITFLEGIKLDKYCDIFSEEDVDGKLLLTLTVEALEDMGIKNAFHCRKIHTKFRDHLQKLLK